MEKLQESILDFFSNEKLLKQIRTGAIILILLLIPFFYFGFKDTFTFDALLSWDFGGAVAIITLSILLATIETKSVAFDFTIEIDDDLIPLQDTIQTNGNEIQKLDKTGKRSILWCNKYNKDQQQMYDEIKTNDKINILEKKVLRYTIDSKFKKVNWCEEQIEKLKKNHLVDKKFIPYNIKRIINVDKIGIKINKKKGDHETKSNPKKVSLLSIIFGMPIRAAGLGVLSSIPFLMNESAMTIFLFYIAYILTMTVTILSQYVITSYKTTHSHKSALKTIVRLQGLLLTRLRQQLQIDEPKEDVDRMELIE